MENIKKNHLNHIMIELHPNDRSVSVIFYSRHSVYYSKLLFYYWFIHNWLRVSITIYILLDKNLSLHQWFEMKIIRGIFLLRWDRSYNFPWEVQKNECRNLWDTKFSIFYPIPKIGLGSIFTVQDIIEDAFASHKYKFRSYFTPIISS